MANKRRLHQHEHALVAQIEAVRRRRQPARAGNVQARKPGASGTGGDEGHHCQRDQRIPDDAGPEVGTGRVEKHDGGS
jgi:hypothetical protein